MQKTSIVAFRRGYRLQWEAAQESHVILYPEGMAKLNETAAAILELVDGRRDVAAIIAMLNERFPEAGGVDDTGLLADFAAVNRIGNTLNNTNLVIFSDLSSSVSYNGGLFVAPKYKDDLGALDGSEGWITSIGTVSEYFNWQAQTYLGLDPSKQKNVNTDSISTH